MNKEQLERLLNTACEIITDMEYAYFEVTDGDKDMMNRIDTLFNEISELGGITDPDGEAQDWDTFGDKKI